MRTLDLIAGQILRREFDLTRFDRQMLSRVLLRTDGDSQRRRFVTGAFDRERNLAAGLGFKWNADNGEPLSFVARDQHSVATETRNRGCWVGAEFRNGDPTRHCGGLWQRGCDRRAAEGK